MSEHTHDARLTVRETAFGVHLLLRREELDRQQAFVAGQLGALAQSIMGRAGIKASDWEIDTAVGVLRYTPEEPSDE